jgi:hypothetical protein
MVTISDLGQGTLDTLQEAAELLCRAYPSASAGELRTRTRQRLSYISRLLGGRLTLAQHRELLVTIGWLALLLGCVHYDLGEREQAEAARQAAYQAGMQAGHGEIIAWSYELAAWFAQPCVARPTRTASAASANVWRVVTVPYQHFEAPGLARPARVLARFTSRRANAERQFGAPSAGAGWEDA